jgi:pyruvate dehydrogenase E2 component (dihydrolipoamide acetyltransferase)
VIVDVVMPRLSDTMTEGGVACWHVAVEEQVQQGQDLCDIDTDKVTVTYESPVTGLLREIVAGEDEDVEVGQPIARIEVDG